MDKLRVYVDIQIDVFLAYYRYFYLALGTSAISIAIVFRCNCDLNDFLYFGRQLLYVGGALLYLGCELVFAGSIQVLGKETRCSNEDKFSRKKTSSSANRQECLLQLHKLLHKNIKTGRTRNARLRNNITNSLQIPNSHIDKNCQLLTKLVK